MENKNVILKVDFDLDGNVFILGEGESHITAEILDAFEESKETQERARRIVECYNLFKDIDSPTDYFNFLKKNNLI